MNQVFWYERPGGARDCPCLFVDRDGVLVEEVNYLHRLEDVRLLAGATALVHAAKSRGFAVGIVTNQAGIARGYYDWAAFEAVQKRLVELLGLGDDPFDFVAACGAHPEGSVASLRVDGHSWRKPNPGMLLAAQRALGLDLPASVMVGDQLSDMKAAAIAGLGRAFHVATGHGSKQRDAVCAHAPKGATVVDLASDLTDVARMLGWGSTEPPRDA